VTLKQATINSIYHNTISSCHQVVLETASAACCGTPAGSVRIDVDVLRCRSDVSTPTHRHQYSLQPYTLAWICITGQPVNTTRHRHEYSTQANRSIPLDTNMNIHHRPTGQYHQTPTWIFITGQQVNITRHWHEYSSQANRSIPLDTGMNIHHRPTGCKLLQRDQVKVR